MPTQQFVTIKESEFQDWSKEEFKAPEYMHPKHGQEIVIRQKQFSFHFELHLYTSLVNGTTRDNGEDAVRLVLYDAKSLMVISSLRVNRVEGVTTVFERIKTGMDVLYKLGQSQEICPKCSSHMVERENRSNGNKFMGCSAFPVCPRGGVTTRAYPLKSIVHIIGHKGKTLDGSCVVSLPAETEIKYTELVREEDCIPTEHFPELAYPFEKFNLVQSTLLDKELDINDCNLVLGTSTSSGKTICAELFMLDVLKRKEVILYVSPLKSLAEEKAQEWVRFQDHKLCMITGDYQLTPKRARELDEADIIILTSEMIDSRTRNKDIEQSKWLSRVGLVIMDESHIIATGRGHCVEAGLMRFSRINPKAQILCLSATMPNVEDFKKWLTILNGKNTEVINSNWRPTKLHWEFQEYNTVLAYKDQQRDKIARAMEIILNKRDEKTLCFVHDKATGRMLLKQMELAGIDAAFHSADATLADRLDIEDRFENDMNVLIATSTLAWGKNTSAKNVIIVGVTRGLNAVDELDIIQEAGRAGRLGRAPEGTCYLICDDEQKWRYKVANPRLIESTLLNEGILGFHILAEVKIGSVSDFETLKIWFERSLAFLQEKWDATLIEKVLGKLVAWEMLHINNVGKYQVTQLGMVSASLYYIPQDIYHWYIEFGKIKDLDLWDNDLALSWALGSVPSKDYGYVPREAQDRVLAYSDCLRTLRLQTCDSVRAADLYDLFTGNEVRFSARDFQYDAERIAEALKWIDGVARWGKEKTWKSLPSRLKYGIGKELVELCSIKGVGTVKARKLYNAGIKSLSEFTDDNRQKIARVLGNDHCDKLLAGGRVMRRRSSSRASA